jgi:hypothetical protein
VTVARSWPQTSLPPAVRACLVILAIFLSEACGGSDSSPSRVQPQPPVESQPLPAEYRSLLESVAAARSLPAPADLRLGVLNRSQVPALLDALLTQEDRAEFGRTTRLYRLLGYLGPDDDYGEIFLRFAAHAFAAVYDHPRRTIWLVAPDGVSTEAPEAVDRATLIHEMVHALQFSALDVAATAASLGGSPDPDLAFSAVLEGDATSLTTELNDGAGPAAAGQLGAAPAGIPAPIERTLRFPYEVGADFVRAARAAGGNAAVDSLLRTPPPFTAVLLHRTETVVRAPVQPTLPDNPHGLPGEWKRTSGGTLGEFELRNFLLQRLRGLDASTAAATWSGDTFAVYESGSTAVLAVHIVTTGPQRSALLADAFARWSEAAGATVTTSGSYAIADAGDGRWLAWAAAGNDILLTIATDRDTAERALQGLVAP